MKRDLRRVTKGGKSEEERQRHAERTPDRSEERLSRPVSERDRRKRAVATCSNSFGVSLEEARQKEGDGEQNKSNQGIFRRRDVWPKSIRTPSLWPALSRHGNSVSVHQCIYTHTHHLLCKSNKTRMRLLRTNYHSQEIICKKVSRVNVC